MGMTVYELCVQLVPNLSPKNLETAEYVGLVEGVGRHKSCFPRALRTCVESQPYLGCKRSWVQIRPVPHNTCSQTSRDGRCRSAASIVKPSPVRT
jgi:hypothetical protein